MKAILSSKNDNLLLELQSDKNRKVLLDDETVGQNLKKLADVLKFKGVDEMIDLASKADETIFEFDRVYDSGETFSFEILEGHLQAKKIDAALPKKLQMELENYYLSDLAASAIECIFDNFVYTIIDQMHQLLIKELDIEVQTFDKGHYDRLIEIIGGNAGLADIKVNIVNEEKNG